MEVGLLITPKELADLSGIRAEVPSPESRVPDKDTKVQILDLRPAEDFARGRIPGAIHLDLWAFSLNDTDPAPLKAFLWMIAHVLAARGIDPSHTVVVYDEKSGIRAARGFWFLEYFGHPDVRMLDGGFTAWSRAGLPVQTPTEDPRTKDQAPSTASVSGSSDWPERAKTRPDRLATWRDVHDRLGSKDAVILDTRSAEEYYGELVRARRGGAVPGAVHIDWTRNLNTDGAFKPRDELRAMYEKAGVTPDREVVTYCQGGYRAAHSYLALRLLGYPRVRAYLGSWKEWGDREDLPIESPKRS
jgi:thiosulfate/3-mercaptopyruvate sulfurtransferase